MNFANFIVPLFVPANRPDRFSKAASSGADAIIIDLEDAVPSQDKGSARDHLATYFTSVPVLVRINGEETQWYEDDVSAVSKVPLVAGIIVPKARFSDKLFALAAKMDVPIIALIESALGVADATRIAALPGIAQLAFGSVDYCADLGCQHTRTALLMARSQLVLTSRLAGLPPPIDGVTVSIDDAEVIQSDARYSRELGFGGKLAIHPRQIGSIRSGFRPTAEEIDWATKVLASADGATAVDGAMVDEPVRIRARTILSQASR